MLRWAREHGCPWDQRTCEAAAGSGHLDVVRWAWERGCPWDPYTLHALREGCPELRALWDEAAPVAAWEGVRFGEAGGADAGRVVKLDLNRRGLTGDVPAALGGLTALTTLNLWGNRLTSLPAALGGLTALKSLYLGGNQLTSVPAELGGLSVLERLYLNMNQLTSVPAELGALTALTALFLYGNRMRSVPAEWVEGGALEQSGCDIMR